MEIEIRHHPDARLEALAGFGELFSERGFGVSMVRHEPGPINAMGLPEVITIIMHLTIGGMVAGFFKKPGEDLYLAFKTKFLMLLGKSRQNPVRWMSLSQARENLKEPTLNIPGTIPPALSWQCNFPFSGGYPISTKFTFMNELSPTDLELAFDKIRVTLSEMEHFRKWYQTQLRCRMDDPKWLLGESYPGDNRVFLMPAKNILDNTIGGNWLFNRKYQMWVREC